MKKFRTYQKDQLLLLPPSLNEWLPKGHLAQFVSDTVDLLDLSAIYDAYNSDKGGQPAYHPLMMVKLIVYGYSIGLRSSRQIERATWESVPFRFLSADQHPDHDSIANFRKRHLPALAKLFDQVLRIAMEANLADFYHVAVDGSKIKANASPYKSMSAEKANKQEEKLTKRIAEIFAEAEKVDQEEDAEYGNRSMFQLPKELQEREARLEKIKEFKERIEAEQKAIDEQVEEAKRNKKPPVGGKKRNPKEKKPIVRNSTDYESRVMHQAGGNWAQTFNAQIVVDGKDQIIVAADVTNECSDVKQLVPMLTQVTQNTGKTPDNASADTGYFSNANVKAQELRDTNLLVRPKKKKPRKINHGKFAFTASDRMHAKLEQDENKALYKLRKTIVEPVFGQIKSSVQAFHSFSFRGLSAVKNEWSMICMTHNLMKLYRWRVKPA
jgi:transposase